MSADGERGEDVMAYCAGLATDFARFRSEWETLGKHLTNAQSKYGEAGRRLETVERGLERATEWGDAVEAPEPVELAELQRAADAA